MKTRFYLVIAFCGVCSMATAQSGNTQLGVKALDSNTTGYRTCAVFVFSKG